jgi:hypothetical protein
MSTMWISQWSGPNCQREGGINYLRLAQADRRKSQGEHAASSDKDE